MPREKIKQMAATQTETGSRNCSELERTQNQVQHSKDKSSDDKNYDILVSLPSTSQMSNSSSSLSSQNQTFITISLTSLPLIVLTQIIDSLFTKDVVMLSCVNKFFSSLISSLYTLSVTLPGPPPTSPGSSVLSLRLSSNLSHLPAIDSFHPFQALNLRKLKQLELTGLNHIWNKQYLLSEKYKDWLQFLLTTTNKVSLQKIEFLADESKRCIEIVKNVATFINLTEVTLHGIGYFNPTASYHMDKDIAQKIINTVLINNRIKILRLKSFQTLNRCLILESESLEELYVDFGKNFEIGLLYLPCVRIISMETSMWFGCFYHAQNGELKKIVAQGCPRLESFNSTDLASLSSMSESGHWLDQLRTFSASRQMEEGQCVLCTQPEDM